MSGKLEQIFEKEEETETSQKQRLCYGSLCSRGVAGCSSKVLFKNLYVKERRTILPTWARNGEECSAGGGEGTDDGGSCKIWRLGQELHAFSNFQASFPARIPLETSFSKDKKKTISRRGQIWFERTTLHNQTNPLVPQFWLAKTLTSRAVAIIKDTASQWLSCQSSPELSANVAQKTMISAPVVAMPRRWGRTYCGELSLQLRLQSAHTEGERARM